MYDHILVATDGSEPAATAVDRSIDLASAGDGALTAVSVIDTRAYGVTDLRSEIARDPLREEAETALSEVESTAASAGIHVQTEVLTGSPANAIREYATEHEGGPVVVGTHGRRGVKRVLLGSVAERVARTAPDSVLVVREAE